MSTEVRMNRGRLANFAEFPCDIPLQISPITQKRVGVLRACLLMTFHTSPTRERGFFVCNKNLAHASG